MNPHGTMAPDEALARVRALPTHRRVIQVPPHLAAGRVCAEDLATRFELPPFDRATMDGFAVASAAAPNGFQIVNPIAAGGGLPETLAPGTAAPISTGAPVPAGTHGVVPIEKVRVDGTRVHFEGAVSAGANIVPRGAEGAAGTPLFEKGRVFTAQTIAAAVAAGHVALPIWAPPTVGLLVSGDEVGGTGDSQIPDANGPLLLAMLASLGIEGRLIHRPDELEALSEGFASLAACDVIITTGGVSMGPRDLIPPMLRAAGAEMILHGVAQKPGKPMLVAVRGKTRIFSLPGNPLAVHLGMHRYVLPHLRSCLGLPQDMFTVNGILSAAVGAAGGRDEFMPVDLVRQSDGSVAVLPFPANSSGHLLALCRARGLWHRKKLEPPAPPGTPVTVDLLESPADFNSTPMTFEDDGHPHGTGGVAPIPTPAEQDVRT